MDKIDSNKLKLTSILRWYKKDKKFKNNIIEQEN